MIIFNIRDNLPPCEKPSNIPPDYFYLKVNNRGIITKRGHTTQTPNKVGCLVYPQSTIHEASFLSACNLGMQS